MLSERDQAESLHATVDVIAKLSGASGRQFHTEPMHVEAKVRNRTVLADTITVQFTVYFDKIRISFMWEDAGYENYKSKGLYGYADTNWQRVSCDDHFMYVETDTYELRVTLPQRHMG